MIAALEAGSNPKQRFTDLVQPAIEVGLSLGSDLAELESVPAETCGSDQEDSVSIEVDNRDVDLRSEVTQDQLIGWGWSDGKAECDQYW